MNDTQQQNTSPLTVEAIISALFGTPTFTSSIGDPFESKAPDGSGGKWMGRRVASAHVPILVNGTDVSLNFACTVYKDVSPDGESYAVRVSLPQGASKWQSAFSGDESIISALKYHIADAADRWLTEIAKNARPTSNTASTQPRLVVRKVAKPDAPPAPATTPEALRGMTEAEYEALRAQVVAQLAAGATPQQAADAVNAQASPTLLPVEQGNALRALVGAPPTVDGTATGAPLTDAKPTGKARK